MNKMTTLQKKGFAIQFKQENMVLLSVSNPLGKGGLCKTTTGITERMMTNERFLPGVPKDR